MKSLRAFGIVLGAMLLAASVSAGDGYLGVQITNGQADIAYPANHDGFISAGQPHSEVGVGIQYWRLMSNDYAFNFSATYGTFAETDQPGNGATAPFNVDQKYTQTSCSFRFGGDRAVRVGERAIFYFGPGLEYWSGKAKFEGYVSDFDSDPYETGKTNRYGVSGRIGALMLLSRSAGFNCQVGRYVAMARAEQGGAKATWWPSGFQASGGFVLRLPM